MCSSPGQLRRDGTLELAVKRSSWPPAVWVHGQCRVGSRVTLKAGGSFFFQPSAGAPVRPLLLVAGGVGVNPLISILRHCRDLRDEARHTGHGYTPMPVALVYSARSPAELLFKECIGAMEEEGLVTAHLFVTGKSLPAQDGRYHRGRLTSADLREVVRRLGADPLCYLCGPSAMIADVERWLTELGVPPESVRYERWW
ncbi:oxidoreductase NAD-binding domain-containing protein 1-like isoform X3 [Pollicipes pollicipes]|nr:oxidoreductase NAD-binding domain-containing protein 1-like isoform X3 [Pollicipes pollicipes]XP_037092539.1 oxidoreductase NAD-binding domain-containing protein 1-like isoform X3 [Pollicipes pollicipes]XP_037092540.1 oxidoreductase NAD-binding domain-containing protein 1-like isoform X3 [Pollicipes pollicipes]